MIKQIEKTTPGGTIQYFEIITSISDLRKYLSDYWKDALWCNAYHEKIQETDATPEVLPDSSIAWRMNGIEYAFCEGDLLPRRPNANNIDQFIIGNEWGQVIYKVEIQYDAEEEYFVPVW